MGWKGLLRNINKAASVAKDVEAISSFNSKKIGKRAKDKVKGKVFGKLWRLF